MRKSLEIDIPITIAGMSLELYQHRQKRLWDEVLHWPEHQLLLEMEV